ncbi:hypothetical protein IR014_01605 [Pseudomonas asiatica]|nr:hypothetical protein [Pseudomonas asiatica]
MELAAKASGLEVEWRNNPDECGMPCLAEIHLGVFQAWWNPLDDDGDALRLAAYQHMLVDLSRFGIAVEHTDGVEPCREPEDYRRAIVRAAAEIGKAMQESM